MMKKEGGGENFSATLLAWYDSQRRILPWREDPTPYHVWVSEIMLQQTRVDTVIDYYNRFLEALPDVESLAQAEEETLLKLWQGLGYYSRVRNMHSAAKQVMEEFGGRIPETPEELQKLKGIGEYVAAAISSIAFGYPVPSVDGNLLRVYARMTAYGESIRTTSAKKVAKEYYRDLLPLDRPGDMNQALMDLGATICLPNGMPLCEKCPWQNGCQSRAMGCQGEIPVKEEKKKRRQEKRTVLRIQVGDRLVIRKRPAGGLLGGMYEFPSREGWLTEEAVKDACRALGIEPKGCRKLKPTKHIFSHVEWHMQGYEILGELLPEGDRWKAEQSEEISSTESPIILATRKEIAETYSVPTAYRAYFTEA